MANEEHVAYTITSAGSDIIARIIAGENITFKRIAIGDGFDYDVNNFKLKTELVNEVLSLANLEKTIETSSVVKLVGQFTTADLQDSFYYRELGIYVVDPDDSNKEILFAYGNKNDKATYVTPHVDGYVVLKEIECLTFVGDSANVNIIINDNSSGSNSINFNEDDWNYDEENKIYNLSLGIIGESIKVFNITNARKKDVPLVAITKTISNSTILQSLSPFDGCVISV